MNLIAYATDLVKETPGADIVVNDPVMRFFLSLNKQMKRLQKLKILTFQHAWIREKDGKLSVEPLDDEFDKIQKAIAKLESEIAINEDIALQLEEYYKINNMEGGAFYSDQRNVKYLESKLFNLTKESKQEKGIRLQEIRGEIANLHTRIEKIKQRADGVTVILRGAIAGDWA